MEDNASFWEKYGDFGSKIAFIWNKYFIQCEMNNMVGISISINISSCMNFSS